MPLAGFPWRRALGLAALVIGLMLLGRQVAKLGWIEVGEALARVPLVSVAGVLALTGVRFAFWAVRWRRLMHRFMPPPVGTLLAVVLASTAIGHTLPFGRFPAGLARARLVSRRTGVRTSTVYGTVLMDQSLTTAMGLVLMLAGVIVLLGAGADASRMPGGPWTWGLLAALVLTALILVPLLRRGRRDAPVEEPESRWGRLKTGFLESLAHPLDAAMGLALSALVIGGTVAAELLVLHALGAGLPVAAALAAVSLGGMAGAVAGSPGGLGVAEAAGIEVYTSLGVGGEAAAAAVLITRACHLFWVLGVGGVSLTVLGGGAALTGKAAPSSGNE